MTYANHLALSFLTFVVLQPTAPTNEYLDAINKVRAEHGKAPLTWSDERARCAQGNAGVVARTRRAFHPRRYPIGSGEIMARGQTSIQETCGDWLNSPGHRRLLLGDFSACGAARVGNVWFVQFE